MLLDRVLFVLEKLAELKEHFPKVGFFFLDEPTNHPHFVEIIERASELGLLGEDFFISTNGSILARAPDEVWARLKKAGVEWLQLTLYGMERTHDDFARRRGAFRDVIVTARRAAEQGIRWWLGVILHPDNAHELVETMEYAKSLDPRGEASVGWYTFLWQGRGRSAKRPRAKDYVLLPDSLKGEGWVEEREAVRRIVAGAELSARRADETLCPHLVQPSPAHSMAQRGHLGGTGREVWRQDKRRDLPPDGSATSQMGRRVFAGKSYWGNHSMCTSSSTCLNSGSPVTTIASSF